MEIASFAVDPAKNTPLVVLKESSGHRTLAVAISPAEASAIAIKSLNVATGKPLTIDLVKLIMDGMGGQLDRVSIYDVVNGSLSTRLHVVWGSNVTLIDCAASDAIALAIRCDAPIFALEEVFEKASPGEKPTPQQELRRHIAGLETMEFGKHFLE